MRSVPISMVIPQNEKESVVIPRIGERITSVKEYIQLTRGTPLVAPINFRINRIESKLSIKMRRI